MSVVLIVPGIVDERHSSRDIGLFGLVRIDQRSEQRRPRQRGKTSCFRGAQERYLEWARDAASHLGRSSVTGPSDSIQKGVRVSNRVFVVFSFVADSKE